MKTIKELRVNLGYTHPAVGRLFTILFTDGTWDKVYEETFFIQFIDYSPKMSHTTLLGRKLDVDVDYYNFD